jgi:hypothetical protein
LHINCSFDTGSDLQLAEFETVSGNEDKSSIGCGIAMYGATSEEPQNMRLRFPPRTLWHNAKRLIILTLLSGTALTQDVSMAKLNGDLPDSSPASALANPSAVMALPAAVTLPEAPSHRKFWDTENSVLFTTVAALSAADFVLTRSILQNGGKELNPVTRLFTGSTTALAANFAGETAGIIGISYLFHKTGHHQLERITPMLNIGASSFAVIYDLNHR